MHRVVVEMVTSPEESRDCNPVIPEVVGLPTVMATEEDAAVVAVVVHIRRLTNQILFHSLHGMSLAGLNIIVNLGRLLLCRGGGGLDMDVICIVETHVENNIENQPALEGLGIAERSGMLMQIELMEALVYL